MGVLGRKANQIIEELQYLVSIIGNPETYSKTWALEELTTPIIK